MVWPKFDVVQKRWHDGQVLGSTVAGVLTAGATSDASAYHCHAAVGASLWVDAADPYIVPDNSCNACAPTFCGTFCMRGPIVCGTSCVYSPIVCGQTCVRGAIICGTSCVKSPIVYATTCVDGTIGIFDCLCASTCAKICGAFPSIFSAEICNTAGTACPALFVYGRTNHCGSIFPSNDSQGSMGCAGCRWYAMAGHCINICDSSNYTLVQMCTGAAGNNAVVNISNGNNIACPAMCICGTIINNGLDKTAVIEYEPGQYAVLKVDESPDVVFNDHGTVNVKSSDI